MTPQQRTRRLAAAAALALTPALANAGNYEFFDRVNFWEIKDRMVATLGPADADHRYISCVAINCENRRLYWRDGTGFCTTLTYAISENSGVIERGARCTTRMRKK